MEKVKVSKKVFEALERFKNLECGGLTKLVKIRARGFLMTDSSYQVLNDLTFEEAIEIYKHGYELEETPEEKLLRQYNFVNNLEKDEYDRAYLNGVKFTLDTLNIKIKGINE